MATVESSLLQVTNLALCHQFNRRGCGNYGRAGQPPYIFTETKMTKPISSHSCGNGRYARMVWGKREDCDRCKQADAQFKAAQEFYRKRDLIADADPVNVLLQKEERVTV